MEGNIVSYTEIRRIFGDISDHQVAEIIVSGLPLAELEKIAILLAGDTDRLRESGRLTPKSQTVYDMLLANQEQWETDQG